MIRRWLAGALLLPLPFAALAADLEPTKNAGPYVPSPQSVVADMLRYAEVSANDFIIDLGSADGRIVLAPARVPGKWRIHAPWSKQAVSLELKQQLTRVSGNGRVDGQEIPLGDVRLRGDRISFKLTGRKGEYSGQVKETSIGGIVDNGN